MNRRLFVDMDGTLAHFIAVEKFETLYEEGYYAQLPAHNNLVAAIKRINSNPDIDVYILSAVLENSKYAEKEKREWLQRYLPDLKPEQIIFTPCGQSKTSFIADLSKSDTLLDDYTVNLNDWTEHGGSGIKFVNRINSKHGRWKGFRIYHWADPLNTVSNIERFINNLPVPQETSSIANHRNNVFPKVYQCSFYDCSATIHKVNIAAYDKLDASVLFRLHMKGELIEDSIKEVSLQSLKPTSHCLNFENPCKKTPER